MTRRKRIRKAAKDWWDRTEKKAIHPDVKQWHQIQARITLTVLLVGLAFLLYLLGILVAVLIVVAGFPVAVWRQFDRIKKLWSDQERYKPPEVVR